MTSTATGAVHGIGPSTPNEGIDMTIRTSDPAAGDSFDLGSVEAAVAVAIRAPSIYNTQPPQI